MFKLFKDSTRQATFEKNGFALLSNLLQAEEIQQLKEFYQIEIAHNAKNSIYGMYVSLDEINTELKNNSKLLIQKIVTPKLDKFFQNYKTHLGSFLVKLPDDFSYTYPHQDWQFVRQADVDFFSATIWISLNDINTQTGNLGFIKGSHNFFDNIVGSPSPEIITSTMGHEKLLLSYLQFQDIKAGDAFIFNNKTIHAAFPNRTRDARVAVGIGITPIQADIYHYFLKPNTTNKIIELKVGSDFFENYTNLSLRETYKKKQIPKYSEIIQELDYIPQIVSAEQMESLILQSGNVKNNLPIESLFANVQLDFMTKLKFAIKYFRNKLPI